VQKHIKVVYLLKSPPWILKDTVSLGGGLTWETKQSYMKFLMTRWNLEPL